MAEPRGQNIHPLKRLRHKNLARDVAIVLVETRHRLLEDAVLVAHAVEQETLIRGDAAIAHAEDLERRTTLLDVDAEDVALVDLGGGDLLRHLEAFEGLDGVAHGGRVLKPLFLGRLRHAGAEILEDLVGSAFEKLAGIGARAAIVVERTDCRDARRPATMDLKLKARPAPVAIELLAARADAEDAMDERRGPAAKKRGDVRPAVSALVLGHLADDVKPRVGLAQGQLEVGMILVVAKENVVVRLVALDEIVLKRQRLALAVRDQDVEVGDLRHHRDLVKRSLVPRLKVRPHAVLEHPRLAHIDDRPVGVLEHVDAGRDRKLFELRVKFAKRDIVLPFRHGLWIVPDATGGPSRSRGASPALPSPRRTPSLLKPGASAGIHFPTTRASDNSLPHRHRTRCPLRKNSRGRKRRAPHGGHGSCVTTEFVTPESCGSLLASPGANRTNGLCDSRLTARLRGPLANARSGGTAAQEEASGAGSRPRGRLLQNGSLTSKMRVPPPRGVPSQSPSGAPLVLVIPKCDAKWKDETDIALVDSAASRPFGPAKAVSRTTGESQGSQAKDGQCDGPRRQRGRGSVSGRRLPNSAAGTLRRPRL